MREELRAESLELRAESRASDRTGRLALDSQL